MGAIYQRPGRSATINLAIGAGRRQARTGEGQATANPSLTESEAIIRVLQAELERARRPESLFSTGHRRSGGRSGAGGGPPAGAAPAGPARLDPDRTPDEAGRAAPAGRPPSGPVGTKSEGVPKGQDTIPLFGPRPLCRAPDPFAAPGWGSGGAVDVIDPVGQGLSGGGLGSLLIFVILSFLPPYCRRSGRGGRQGGRRPGGLE